MRVLLSEILYPCDNKGNFAKLNVPVSFYRNRLEVEVEGILYVAETQTSFTDYNQSNRDKLRLYVLAFLKATIMTTLSNVLFKE